MSKPIDETGKTYGYLTVIERAPNKEGKVMWRCKCKCGNEVIILGASLRNGKTKSCGCYRKQKSKENGKAIDETGKTYGYLIVIERAPNNSKYRSAMWRCKCKCGNEIIVKGDKLRNGNTKSCGCYRKQKSSENNMIDISGQVFGRLTAIRPIDVSNDGSKLWECQCKCGNKHIASIVNLRRGSTQSCGCLSSRGEMLCQKWLTDNNIVFKSQYTPKGCLLSSGYPPRYDFALFNKDKLVCLVEYNGIQHEKYSGSGWDTKENFEKTKKSDEEKSSFCSSHNIPLYIIWYYENIEDKLLEICQKENLK